jgi:hypothetical protein
MLDFDSIDDWAPVIAKDLSGHVPNSVATKILSAAPECIEDALDLLFKLTDRNAVINVVVNLIRRETIAGYHGSRLTDEEITSIQSSGLTPLEAQARRRRLLRALSPHRKWQKVAGRAEAPRIVDVPGKNTCCAPERAFESMAEIMIWRKATCTDMCMQRLANFFDKPKSNAFEHFLHGELCDESPRQ